MTRGFQRFPGVVWVVLVGTLLTRTAFFLVWPFLAVILEREHHLSPARIGALLGAAALASAVVGFYAGYLSDRLGRWGVMGAGCASAVAAYAGLAMAQSVYAYGLGALLAGFARAALEAPGKALIADSLADRRSRELAFHARYFLINVGGAVGPLAGLLLGLAARQATFWVTAGVYGAFGLAVALMARRAPRPPAASGEGRLGAIAAAGLLGRDRRFLLLVLAMTLSLAAYAQQESTLVQYISVEGGATAVRLVTLLLITNASTIIVVQFPMLRLLDRQTLAVRIFLGLALFGVAFLAYAVLSLSSLTPWILATGLLSVGEAILFPTLQLQVDRMAPDGLKGSYFGAAGLSAVGFGVGPIAGGLLLEHAGGPAAFVVTAGSMIVCAACYRAAMVPATSGRSASG